MFEGLAKQIKAKEGQPAAKPTLPLATVPAPRPDFIGPLPLAVAPVAEKKPVAPAPAKKAGLFGGLADTIKAKETQAQPAPTMATLPQAQPAPVQAVPPPAPVEEKGFLRKAAEGVFDFGKRTVASAGSNIVSAAKFGADYVAHRPSQAIGAFAGPTTMLALNSIAPKLDQRVGKTYDVATDAGLNPLKKAADVTREYSDKVNKPSPEWEKLSLGDKITKHPLQTINVLAPQIVGSIVPYLINPAAGFAVSVGSTAEDVKRKALENGVSREKAENLGLGTGLAVGVVDKLSFSKIVPKAIEQKFVGGLLTRLIKAGATEATTEAIQENIQIAAEATFRHDLGWDEIKTRNAMSALGGLLGGVGLGGGVDLKENIDEKPSEKPTLPKKKVAVAPIVNESAPVDVAPASVPTLPGVQETTPTGTPPQGPETTKGLFQGLANRVKTELAPTVNVDTQAKPVEVASTPQVAPIQESVTVPPVQTVAKTEPTLTLPQADKRPLEVFNLPDNPKTNEVMAQLAFAEAGKRNAVRNEDTSGLTFSKQESTFPKWIPEKLRRKPLLDSVVKNLSEGTLPTKAAERRLYRVVTDHLKAENDIPNPERTIDQERQATADAFGTPEENAQKAAEFDTQKAQDKSVEIASAQNQKNSTLPMQLQQDQNFEAPETKASKVGKSIETKAIEKGLVNSFSDTAEYDPITIKDQARRAGEIMQGDIERAKRIVLGEEKLPEGLRAGTMIVAMENYAMENGDAHLLLKIANSPLTAETSVHAQELRLLAERDPDSAVALIQKVKKMKDAASEKRGISKNEVVSDIRQKVRAERKSSETKESWASFIDSITC